MNELSAERMVRDSSIAAWAKETFAQVTDSLDWLAVAASAESSFGVRLADEAISRIHSATDLAGEILAAPTSAAAAPRFDAQPAEFLGQHGKYWLQPLRPAELGAAWLLHITNVIVMRTLFRLRVSGLENLPRSGPFVIAPHHSSYLDPFVLAAALRFTQLKQTYWATCVRLAFGPVAKILRRWTHSIPVDAQLGAASSLAYGLAVLQRGQNLVWFPEGRLSPQGDVLPLAGGLGVLLERFPVPVIPVLIRGTFEALPLGRRIPRLARCEVIFAPPLSAVELAQRGLGPTTSARITVALQTELLRLFHEKNASGAT